MSERSRWAVGNDADHVHEDQADALGAYLEEDPDCPKPLVRRIRRWRCRMSTDHTWSVTRCRECPWYQHRPRDWSRCTWRKRSLPDIGPPPDWCPLRTAPALVQLEAKQNG